MGRKRKRRSFETPRKCAALRMTAECVAHTAAATFASARLPQDRQPRVFFANGLRQRQPVHFARQRR
jgi:hypothetical protein